MERGPLIVQSDLTLLLEVEHPDAAAARDALVGFAELVKSPEHIHTYRLTPLSLWNAQAAGMRPEQMLANLNRFTQYPIPETVRQFIDDQGRRYGRLTLLVAPDGDGLWLRSDDRLLLTTLGRTKSLQSYLMFPVEFPGLGPGYRIRPEHRGVLKQALAKVGWPVHDVAGYTAGTPLHFALCPTDRKGHPWSLRPYQIDAIRAFWGEGDNGSGSGVVVLPCGAGKTLVGIGVMAKAQTHTLILGTSTAALHQWRAELLDKTDLGPEDIGEYGAAVKEIRPVTLTTYQMLSHRQKGEYRHFATLDRGNWGLVIYDEVHLVPAPVFRLTASLQARRRLGLTATLIREDGRADEVFALIGPKRHDVPWRVLESQGWIATAECREIRVALPPAQAEQYAVAEDSERARIAAENPAKRTVVRELLAEHGNDHVLVIGQYLQQLHTLSEDLSAPLITGETPVRAREALFEAFRQGEIPVLVVSKVANFSIDLPDANVAIQVSGTFGSRQEEAQRLGRILRPKSDGGTATFYTLVTSETKEQEYAQKRQLFLCEQGYQYLVARADASGRPATMNTGRVTPFPGSREGSR